MKKLMIVLLCLFSISLAEKVGYKNGFGAAIEYGSFYNTNFISRNAPLFNALYNGLDSVFFENTPISRTIGWLSQDITIEDRLNLHLSMGGMFFYVYPIGEESPEELRFGNNRRATLAIDQAYTSYKWGDLDDSYLRLKVGLFNEKYNKNSQNLGEYMFRSKAYPNLVYNGTWTTVGTSFAQLWGLKVELGKESSAWKNSLYITASNTISPPLYDFSLTYITSYDLGPLEIGLGAQLDHFLQLRPDLTSPGIRKVGTTEPQVPSAAHTWITLDAKTIVGQDTLEAGSYAPAQVSSDFYEAAFRKDSGALALIEDEALRSKIEGLKVNSQSFEAVKLLGMASWDVFETFTGKEEKNELTFYTEAIVLGLKDSPIFYKDIKERIPVMAGISLPTWGILDRLSVEGEYWANPYYNDDYTSRNLNIPIPQVQSFASDTSLSRITSDNIKWSVYAEKKVGNHLNFFLQVASDHNRPIVSGFTPASSSVFLQKKSWYYILRMQFSI